MASSTALLPRLLCVYGVSCRAGNPKRLRFAGPQVPSLQKVHLVSPRASGPASGSEPWTTRGEARFAKWASTASAGVGGGLGPGGKGPARRPCSQPRLGPVHPMCHPHSMTSSNLCPARGGQEVRQQGERAERLRQGPQRAASHPCPQPTLSIGLWPLVPSRPWAGLLVPFASPQVPLQLFRSLLAICLHPALLPPSSLLSQAPARGPLLSSSSHCTLSFLCASFFCRSLKPPSFITQWTGSRYCAFLTTLSGASAQPGGRPLALGKVWDVDPGEAFVLRQVYCDLPASRQDRTPKSTGCSFGEKPQVPSLEAQLYQVPGRHGSLGFLPS